MNVLPSEQDPVRGRWPSVLHVLDIERAS